MESIIIKEISDHLQKLIPDVIKAEVAKLIPALTYHSPDVDLLTISEACKILKVSKPTLAKLIRTGNIKAYRLGNSGVRFKKEELTQSLVEIRSIRYSHNRDG